MTKRRAPKSVAIKPVSSIDLAIVIGGDGDGYMSIKYSPEYTHYKKA